MTHIKARRTHLFVKLKTCENATNERIKQIRGNKEMSTGAKNKLIASCEKTSGTLRTVSSTCETTTSKSNILTQVPGRLADQVSKGADMVAKSMTDPLSTKVGNWGFEKDIGHK